MARTAPPGLGLLKGLGITLKQLFTPAATQQYPHERPELEPRTRGVIALMDENCTVCMLCARECPDWCIYIDSHKETVPPAKEGGRARTRNVLDRFAIDFALCMYCGICVEVCPFDALWWSPEFEYAEYRIDGLLHEMGRLREWMDTVPAPPPLDEGAVQPGEVADALAKAEQAALEAQRAAEEAEARSLEEQAGGEGDGADAVAKPKKAEVKVEAGEIDTETYDRLIAEGKSERIARAKAKAAYVRKAKKAAREAPAEAEKPTPEPEIKVEAGEIDTATFDRLIAEGKSERIARAKAKAAYVRKAKQAARAEAESAESVEAPPETDTQASASGGTATEDPPSEPAPRKKLADVQVEGEVEIDTETYDRLIADGKSERIARAKAKAAYVKKQKQKLIDEGEA